MTESTKEAMHEFITQRRIARRLAMITVYQWLMSEKNESIANLVQNMQEDPLFSKDYAKSDSEFLLSLIEHAVNTPTTQQTFEQHLDRNSSQIDPIEHAILLIACSEMSHHIETPHAVVINESINLCKKFGGVGSLKYINAILDQVSQSLKQ